MTDTERLAQIQARRESIRAAGRIPLAHDYCQISDVPIVSPGMVHGRTHDGLTVEIPEGRVLTLTFKRGRDRACHSTRRNRPSCGMCC